mmetsp:Transcript_195/g.671  ORF Transcript_195/g.671 Transcript_195/m.671 type:complete len:219 (-) Transcript_195:236-892(-)
MDVGHLVALHGPLELEVQGELQQDGVALRDRHVVHHHRLAPSGRDVQGAEQSAIPVRDAVVDHWGHQVVSEEHKLARPWADLWMRRHVVGKPAFIRRLAQSLQAGGRHHVGSVCLVESEELLCVDHKARVCRPHETPISPHGLGLLQGPPLLYLHVPLLCADPAVHVGANAALEVHGVQHRVATEFVIAGPPELLQHRVGPVAHESAVKVAGQGPVHK